MQIALATSIVLLLIALCGCVALYRARAGLLQQLEEERSQHQTLHETLRQQNAAMDKDLAVLRQRHEDDERRLAEFRQQLDSHLKVLAGEALQQSNTQFLQLADQRLRPIVDLFNRYDQHYKQIEQSRRQEYGGLSQVTDQLRSQTEALVTALRRPEVRGRWGEIALRRIVELAGLTNRCDFDEQTNMETQDGRLRPDMVVKLPNGRCICIDSKIALDAFLEAVRLPEGDGRTELLQRHIGQINEQVRRLSGKNYAGHLDRSPDFVVLFMHVESALYGAVEVDPALLERAMERKVIIATPTLLIALLKAVEIGWHEQTVAENAAQLRDLGQELHERLAKALGDVVKLGSCLETSVKHYNTLVGTLDSRVMPSARRFEQAGARSPRELPGQLESVELVPRECRSLDQVVDE